MEGALNGQYVKAQYQRETEETNRITQKAKKKYYTLYTKPFCCGDILIRHYVYIVKSFSFYLNDLNRFSKT